MPRSKSVRREFCRVEFYAGSRGEETPRRVVCRGRTLEVERVLERRRLADIRTGAIAESFLLVLDGARVTLRRTGSGRWSLLRS